jgi:nucleoside-diphosphate-sugar epimerase
MHVLVTGATGKVGQVFLRRFLDDPRWSGARVRALCHHRAIPAGERLEIVQGSISDRDVVARALKGITHVLHLATVKEDPSLAMDVSVKGMFWLLEEFRASPTAKQFLLVGGDCSVGHIFVPYSEPITETSPRRAYPGVYAFSKVIEEVMLEQYFVQYGLNGTILRAPWIMEKDDFKYVLSFGDDQFGGPSWSGLISDNERKRYAADQRVPLLYDNEGLPLRRNFIHVEDLVQALLLALDNPKTHQQLFNIAMTEPVDYGQVAAHLARTRNLASATIPTGFHSNILDNAKARWLLGWTPRYDLARLIDEAYAYQRAPGDERKVWYPG